MSAGQGWEAVVVGGGLVGSSIAYHLTMAGMRTLLIEQSDLASGASGANFGMVQVQDTEYGLSLELTLRSFTRFSTLAEELDYDLEFRYRGYLLLIENEQQWATMAHRAAKLQAAGIAARLIDRNELCDLEPDISPDSVIGGLYHPHEGQLNPFRLVHAYALRGREQGLEVWTHSEVTGIRSRGGRVIGVDTTKGYIPAAWVILAAGAWTRQLARTAGVEVPVQWVHGEALVTESLPPLARNAMATSAFFEETEGTEGQVVGFCLNQRPQGNVMIGEAARVTNRLSRRVTATAMPAIATEARRHFPDLRSAAVIRGWAIPVPFTTDNRPLLGPVETLEGLLVATGLKSTIILTPLVGELMAAMVTGGPPDPRLVEFSPSRRFTATAGVRE